VVSGAEIERHEIVVVPLRARLVAREEHASVDRDAEPVVGTEEQEELRGAGQVQRSSRVGDEIGALRRERRLHVDGAFAAGREDPLWTSLAPPCLGPSLPSWGTR